MPNEKLEKLKHEQYVAERKLTAAKHKMEHEQYVAAKKLNMLIEN